MAAKISKLSNQFDRTAESGFGEIRHGIFRGVAIFVNGYTDPTAEELKRIMLAHGGTFHHYYSRSKTTHIIANNLPDSKIKNMNTDRIVSPKWISDSLEAGRLLDYTNYVLYTNQSKTQPKLAFKRMPSTESTRPGDVKSGESSASGTGTVSGGSQDFSVDAGTGEGSLAHWSDDEDLFSDLPEVEVSGWGVNSDSVFGEPGDIQRPQRVSLEYKDQIPSPVSLNENESNPKEGVEEMKSKTGDKTKSVINTSNPATKSNVSPSKGHSMSTANPKFLSEFYNNSRLHHISTMGATFKQYVTEMQNKNEGFSGRKPLCEWVKEKRQEDGIAGVDSMVDEANYPQSVPGLKTKRTIMHIDMDCFFVSVGLRNHPDLRGKPVAVTHSKGSGRSQAREGVDRQYELNYYKERAEKRLHDKMKAPSANKTDTPATTDNFLGDRDGETKQGDSKEPPSLSLKFSTLPLIDDTCSLSEIASCSYEARKAGVRNGMFMGPALKLCPDLKTIPYDFEGYKEVAYKLYDIVASFTHDIEAVSCDEMFVDLTELLNDCKVTPLEFASYLRQEVYQATGCPCSAGMGPNMLIARMATRRAKPNGQYIANPEKLAEYMINEKVTDLPGVGWSMGKRLESQSIKTCGDLQVKSLGQLQSLFGSKTGHSLYYYCRGIDDRPVRSEHVRKSVSAEVNYGIRFTCQADASQFINELSGEVENRLNAINLKGKCITLKLKVRAKDAPVETAKFMGHGVCDNIAKSATLALATSSATIIEREVMTLLRQIKVPPQDFRGVGIQVSRLEGRQGSRSSSGSGNASIKSFMLSAKSKSKKSSDDNGVSVLASFGEKTPRESSRVKSNLSFTSTPGDKSQITASTRSPFIPQHQDSPTPSSKSVAASGKGAIDMEVLMALPEEMRDQVIAEYIQQGYTIPNEYASESISKSRNLVTPQLPGTSSMANPQPGTSSLADPQPGTSSMADSQPGTSSTFTDKNKFKNPESVRDKTAERIPNLFGSEHRESVDQQAGNDDDLGNAEDQDVMITSFSQVDSSFLAALPSEMREELRMDFENKKREASNASLSSSLSNQQRQMATIKNGTFQTNIKSHPKGHSISDFGRGIMQPQQTKQTGKRRGRPPKHLSGINKKSPVKTSKKNTHIISPRKNVRGFVDKASGQASRFKSQDSISDLISMEPLDQTTKVEDPVMQDVKKVVPSLCGAVELAEVKALICEWVSSCPNPDEEDVEIISNYYTSLVSFHDLEKVDLLIKYLYRQVLRTHNPLWQTAYNSITNGVQDVMMSEYEVKLKITPIVVEQHC